jgi:hypothetical protein
MNNHSVHPYYSLPVGINYPWINYGWDFGDPPPTWNGGRSLTEWRAQKRQQIADDFRDFARLGIFAVRWFMLADGLNYGMGSDAPQTDGADWSFAPLPAGRPFYQQMADDFEFVLQTCAELKLKLVPSLIDFHFCFPGSVADQNNGVIKCGRADVVLDPAKREMFFDLALEPLLAISLKYPQTIYAWEPINEPEWCTQKKSFLGLRRKPDPNRTVPPETMREFITQANGRINEKKLPDGSPAFASTIGFAHWETISDWDADELGITLQQFHYYAQDDQAMPGYDLNLNAPCFIGEFASAVERPWPELREFGMAQTLPERLRWVAEKGYCSAFLWSARASDQATLWTRDEHREIAAYLQRPADSLT